MNDKSRDILISPSKRLEKISRQPSERLAFEVAEEWAKKIRQYDMTDRFGMRMSKAARGYWDVYLVDRSIPAEKSTKSRRK
ncbi:hypothetical protein ABZ916_25800 [Streptomyces sp. NPDC046853]|uniref:hypothetical protein n=1 Tax=Streptomyces sp. NPDC046853 TaxID=3154920 RepID=UPI0033F26ED4